MPRFGIMEITDRTSEVGGADPLHAGRFPAHASGTDHQMNHLKGRDKPRKATGGKLL